MARQTIQIVSCDSCGAEPAEPFLLAAGGTGRVQGKVMDLCETHSKPVRDLLEMGRKVGVSVDPGRVAPQRKRKPASTPPPRKIYTPEELDKLEKKEISSK